MRGGHRRTKKRMKAKVAERPPMRTEPGHRAPWQRRTIPPDPPRCPPSTANHHHLYLPTPSVASTEGGGEGGHGGLSTTQRWLVSFVSALSFTALSCEQGRTTLMTRHSSNGRRGREVIWHMEDAGPSTMNPKQPPSTPPQVWSRGLRNATNTQGCKSRGVSVDSAGDELTYGAYHWPT